MGARKNACRHGTEERSPCCWGSAAGEELCCLLVPSAAVMLHSRPASRQLPPSTASAAPGFPRPSLPNLLRKQEGRYGGARRCWAEFMRTNRNLLFFGLLLFLLLFIKMTSTIFFFSLFFFFFFFSSIKEKGFSAI